MLRIIHTGRAYEVLDDDNCPGLLYTLERLRDMFATARDQHWEQNGVLGRTCREVWRHKELLENMERQLRATERELKLCQKSTLEPHGSQGPR